MTMCRVRTISRKGHPSRPYRSRSVASCPVSRWEREASCSCAGNATTIVEASGSQPPSTCRSAIARRWISFGRRWLAGRCDGAETAVGIGRSIDFLISSAGSCRSSIGFRSWDRRRRTIGCGESALAASLGRTSERPGLRHGSSSPGTDEPRRKETPSNGWNPQRLYAEPTDLERSGDEIVRSHGRP